MWNEKVKYSFEEGLRNALLKEDEYGKTIIEKQILNVNTSEEIVWTHFFKEFEIEVGRIDILAIVFLKEKSNFFLDFNVFELKRGQVDIDAVGQALRYKANLKNYIEREENLSYISKAVKIRIKSHLIGYNSSCFNQDHFYIMNELLKMEDKLFIHEYDINPHKGIEIETFTQCSIGEPSSTEQLKSAINTLSSYFMKML